MIAKLFSPDVQYSPFAPEPDHPLLRFALRMTHETWCYEKDRPEDDNVISFPLQPDKAEAERFLAVLDPNANAFTFQTFDDDKERLRARAEENVQRKLAGKKPLPKDDFARIRNGTLDQHWNALCKLNAQRAGVFVTINATDGKGRETENIVRVRALFNDLDGAPLGPVTQSKPTPHIVVELSPGRFHPYWLVDNVELKEFTVLQKGLIEHFDGDKAVHDLPRVMRLPGFVHRKSKPFLSRIISTHDAPAYKAADFGRIIKTTNTKNYFEEVGERERQQSNGPTQKLNDAALANLAAWVPQVFPTARPYHGDGFRVSSVDLGRELEEDISFTREGIKDFGVHDLDDPLEGKRTPVNLVMEHLFEVPVEDIARKNNKAEFRKACEWLRERVEPEQDEPELKKTLMQSSAEFVVGFVPPDYLIDGLLQRRYVYSLTGPTGSGKTAIALRIAIHVALGLALSREGGCQGARPDLRRRKPGRRAHEMDQALRVHGRRGRGGGRRLHAVYARPFRKENSQADRRRGRRARAFQSTDRRYVCCVLQRRRRERQRRTRQSRAPVALVC